MIDELASAVRDYVDLRTTIDDLAAWLASVDWGARVTDERERQRLALVEALVQEAIEGLRFDAEVREELSDWLKAGSTVGQPVVAPEAPDTTVLTVTAAIDAAPLTFGTGTTAVDRPVKVEVDLVEVRSYGS